MLFIYDCILFVVLILVVTLALISFLVRFLVCMYIRVHDLVFSIFFRYGKSTLCRHSRCLSVRPSVRPSVCPSVRLSVRPFSVEITLGRGSDRSAEPIDLKIGINMGNWVVHV